MAAVIMMARPAPSARKRSPPAWRAPLVLCLLPTAARASFMQGEALDSFAMGMAWFVVCVMPVVGITVFWKLHVLPEKIAERRHHPQKDAIHVLCLLSLLVGGLLWPLAWLWAYTRPTGSHLAYGTNKHEDYFHTLGERWRAGELTAEEAEDLGEELDAMAAKSPLPRPLKTLRKDLAAARSAPAEPAPAAGDA